MDDLASLSELDEISLLEELKKRYNEDIFYTYIGDILIALNPYKTLDIYDSEKGKQYTEVGVRSQLPSHIYAISDAAYQNMLRNGASQCCVVSGESGAGKTESTKLMIGHIAQLCRHDAKDDLNDRIVNLNPLLEAFGNAQTVVNNNSSRFGKYVELLFDKTGHLMGANISEYLLEKSRVVCQSPGERNFHIFYYLFAGLDSQRMQANLLKTPEHHRIIRPAGGGQVFANQTEVDHCREMWTVVLNIMNNVGFTEEQVDGVLAILAAILHISDIEFEADPETEGEGVIIKNENIVELASHLLSIDYQQLVEALISTVSNVGSGSETVTCLKTEPLANDGRDALAKTLYGRLFSWMVFQINAQLCNKNRQPDMSIGILDIYGFENFKKNSFEQLCINVTNEQLQCFFNEHIFRWELEEYEREGISGNNVTYGDNKPLLDLFLESLGLFCLLDDESKFPQGTDQSFADKLTNSFSKKSEFRAPKGHCLEFSIQHFAGLVTYNVDGFLEKNRDSFSANLTTCMKKSHAKLVHELFSPVSEFGQLTISSNRTVNLKRFDRQSRMFLKLPDLKASSTSQTSKRLSQMIWSKNGTKSAPKPKLGTMPQIGELSPAVGGSKTAGTLGSQFKNSLISLMNRLSNAQPHFVRCVKPNTEKAANRFKPDMVLQQLRYTGVLETVKIRKQGYPTRLTFVEFMQRYRFASSTSVAAAKPDAKSCSHLLDVIGLKNWQIGHSKVFLRYYHVEQLNALLTEFSHKVSVCQKYMRSFLARQKYKQLQEAARQYNEKMIEHKNIIGQIKDEWVKKQRNLTDEDVENYKQKLKMERLEREIPEKEEQEKTSQKGPRTAAGTIGPSGEISRRVLPFRPTDEETMCASPCECTWRTFKETLLRGSFTDSMSRCQGTIQALLADTLPKLKEKHRGLWAKIYVMEKNFIVGKYYIMNDDTEINDSNCDYTGTVCGLNNASFQHPLGDLDVANVMREVEKGVRISRDKAGNVYLTRLSPCPVRVRGVGDSDVCLASEISSRKGVLGGKQTKVYDISLFKKRIASAVENYRTCDPRDFIRLSTFSFSVGQHTDVDTDSPLWFVVVHIEALSLLGKSDVLKELLSMARIPEDETLKRNWRHLSFVPRSISTCEEAV